ncbi:hypothetical protein EJB05_39590, partial [Eragrostis curvula]
MRPSPTSPGMRPAANSPRPSDATSPARPGREMAPLRAAAGSPRRRAAAGSPPQPGGEAGADLGAPNPTSPRRRAAAAAAGSPRRRAAAGSPPQPGGEAGADLGAPNPTSPRRRAAARSPAQAGGEAGADLGSPDLLRCTLSPCRQLHPQKGGTPKKKGKKANSAQSSILPLEEDAPAASMSFPPSQTLEITTNNKRKHAESTPEPCQSRSLEVSSKKKGQHTSSNSGASKRSRSGSNQPEPLSIDLPLHIEQPGDPKLILPKERRSASTGSADDNLAMKQPAGKSSSASPPLTILAKMYDLAFR